MSIWLYALLGACGTPSNVTLEPDHGPPGTLVTVSGTDLALSVVKWDPGTPDEQVLPGALLGPWLFSVPDVAPGQHNVVLDGPGGSSPTATFKVEDPVSKADQRVDRVSIAWAEFNRGHIDALLFVQVANGQTGDAIFVNGTERATVAYKGIHNPLYGTAFDLAIHHWISYLVPVAGLSPGDSLSVQATATGGLSAPMHYTLPDTAQSIDRDGDGLLDDWETNGYFSDADDVVDVDLPALGADPLRPDLFVELDRLSGVAPASDALDLLVQGFDRAPVINPLAPNGIHLELDTSEVVPYRKYVIFHPLDILDPSYIKCVASKMCGLFTTYKINHFDPDRDDIFHYGLWVDAEATGGSGFSDGGCDGTCLPGDDFIVGINEWGSSYQTPRSHAELLMHELGHNLGLGHMGKKLTAYSPSHLSVMSYSWVLRSSHPAAWRYNTPTCTPHYYAEAGAAEIQGDIPAVTNINLSYAVGMAPALVESSLDEKIGLCGNSVDWNANKILESLTVTYDLSGDSETTVTDPPNWRVLDFGGPSQDGSLLP